MVIGNVRPSRVEQPIEIVEEDPSAGHEQPFGERECQGVDVPRVCSVDVDEVVLRLDLAVGLQLRSEGVVQEPRVARLFVYQGHAPAQTGLLDEIASSRPPVSALRRLSTLVSVPKPLASSAEPM